MFDQKPLGEPDWEPNPGPIAGSDHRSTVVLANADAHFEPVVLAVTQPFTNAIGGSDRVTLSQPLELAVGDA
jgi:hypothetical protein